MVSILKKICNGISAGVMIIIGCAVFLACSAKSDSKSIMTAVGAFFFSVAPNARSTAFFKKSNTFTLHPVFSLSLAEMRRMPP